MAMYTTEWKEFGGGKERIRARYGMDEAFAARNNQEPHISVTGEIEERRGRGRWREAAGGQLHTDIHKHFPNLRDLIPWHLVAEPGVPMHYLDNGQYWWEQYWWKFMGTSKWTPTNVDPVSAFKSTILYGILPGDTDLEFTDGVADLEFTDGDADLEFTDGDADLEFTDAETPPWAMLEGEPAPRDIRPWLETRLPGLQKGFDKVVRDYDLKGSTRANNPGPSANDLVRKLQF